MKRFLLTLAAAALLCACGPDREHTLKVYNWSDYLDVAVIEEFEQWYEEQTGEPVKVILQTFDVNETMLSKIEKGQEDFDVVCPSDYIIERMLQKDLLLPIDRNFGSTPDYISQYLSPFIRDCFDKFDGAGKNANDYAVGYMWGTVGIIYNPKYVTAEEASTWDIFRNPKFAGKLFMKEDARDVFSQIAIFLHHDELERGEVTLDEVLRDSSDEGFTLFFDGWVIPKYAKNPKAASYWINFMNRPDVVIRNVIETGYVSCNAAPEVLEAFVDDSYEPIDLSYFFGPDYTAVRTDPVLYPDRSDIERAGLQHDWGDRSQALIAMWSRVKGDDANAMTAIVIGAVVVAVAAFLIYRRFGGKKHRRPSRKK